MVDSKITVTPNMISAFSDKEEPILFTSQTKKRSRFGIAQSRILVITYQHIYLFDKDKLSRKHKIKNLNAIIKSSMSNQFVLSFP